MIWYYLYIFPEEWPKYRAEGWKKVGYLRPVDWASPNAGNLIIRKREP